MMVVLAVVSNVVFEGLVLGMSASLTDLNRGLMLVGMGKGGTYTKCGAETEMESIDLTPFVLPLPLSMWPTCPALPVMQF